MSPARHHHALPEGYQLHWYEIDSILGQGGFGITYLARDSNLDQLVAIKEFLPSDLAVRTQDSAVQPLSGGHTDTYGWGLNRFLTEARTLAKFRHPNIVRVMSVFEANNTAYMVMEYEHGESFENMLKFKQVNGEKALKDILLALLDGLELVHDAGFIHRDIKPSNIYLRDDGVPVLLDFGSARLALGVETRTLTSLVSPGYAPFEQYNATRDSDKQGPWTDIYALGATMYRAVTGKGPIDAAARANLLLDEQRDPYEACSQLGLENYSQAFLHAIDRALAFPPGERPQSVGAWRQLVVAGAVDSEAETLAVGGEALSGAGVDYVLDGGDGGDRTTPADTAGATVRTVPMAELEAAREEASAAKSSARGWIVATIIAAVVGVTLVAWFSLAPREQAGVEAPAKLAATSPQIPAAPEPAPEADPAAVQPADTRAVVATDTPNETQTPASISAAIAAAAAANANQTSASSAPPAPAANEPVVAQPAPAEPAQAVAKQSAPAPAPEPAANKAPAPPQAPAKKTAPEKVAKAAPAKKPTQAAPKKKEPPAKKSSKPRTRGEKVAALLVSADEHMRADRLTKPKRSNALRDYLTVLAMEKDNATARAGVEQVVERYIDKAEAAIGSAQFDKANENLRSARFVLDAMKLRRWPKESYDALFSDYREANRLLADAR